MKRVRICVITPHPVQYIAPWFCELAENGTIDLQVLYFRELNPTSQGHGFSEEFTWDVPLLDGYKNNVLGFQKSLTQLPGLLLKLRKLIKASRPDVAIVTGWNETALIGSIALLRTMQIPIFIRGESNDLRKRKPWVRYVHRIILSCCHSVLAIGKANKKFYLENGVPISRIFPCPYFVESQRLLQMYENKRHLRDIVRTRAGFEPNDFVFCFVGKHVPFKRPQLLIQAAHLLHQQGIVVKLLFAGSGPLTDELKDMARELNVAAHFLGFLNQTELWRAYLPADAFVLPSTTRETWGLVVNEAMLFGLPIVVSSEVGCAPDLVENRETGFCFIETAEALSASMKELVADRTLAVHLGENARSLVRENYSPTNATNGLLTALNPFQKG